MTKRELEYNITNPLVELGTFASGDYEISEIEIRYDKAVNELFSELINSVESSQFLADLGRVLKKEVLIKDHVNYVYTLPNDYLHLLSDSLQLGITGDEINHADLIPLKPYLVLSEKLYLDETKEWKNKNEVITVNTKTSSVGKVCELKIINSSNRLVQTEDINLTLANPHSKSVIKSVVSQLIGNSIKVYIPEGCEIIIGLYLIYYRKPIKLSTVDMDSELEFPDTVLFQVINRVIASIKNV